MESIPAANCEDLCIIMADFCNEEGLCAQLWVYGPDTDEVKLEHYVVVVGEDVDDVDAVAELGEAAGSRAKRLWVVDPWMNICCPFLEYSARAEEKMKAWEGKGKCFLNEHGNILMSPLDEDFIEAIRGFPGNADKTKSDYVPLFVLEAEINDEIDDGIPEKRIKMDASYEALRDDPSR